MTNDNDDFELEFTCENQPSWLEMIVGTLAFLGSVLLAVLPWVVSIGIAGYFVWLLFKLTVFLMAV